MPGEKELNVNLFERLDLLDRLERVAKKANCEPVLQEIAFERSLIERKLYQKLPLTDRQE
ncbi:MAG: hypothetical protein K2N87_09520 [Eubacterium sp.]|nr:hypothetical protein [Eubacterium sp.]